MDLPGIQGKFLAIGAEFVLQEMPEPRYGRGSDAPFALKVVKNRRGQERFHLEILAKAQKLVTIHIPSIDKHTKSLILAFRFFGQFESVLCWYRKNHWVVIKIPPGTGADIRAVIRAIEEQEQREEALVARANEEAEATAESEGRKGRRNIIPSFDAIQDQLPMSTSSYEFYRHLLDQCRRMKLCRQSDHRAIPQYSDAKENIFTFALMRLADRSPDRIRDLGDWKPRSKNLHKQFSELARHLYAKYPVPEFMDSVWFRKDDSLISWFLALGEGTSIRSVEGFPFPYTKKMAHQMMQAPATLTVEQAIRWGQIMGIGGNERFFHEMERTRIYSIETVMSLPSARHEFWQTVLEWLLRQPMLDPAHYGPIIDFIEHQKFSPPCANPDFEITGRSPHGLLRLVEEWHGALGTATRRDKITWAYHGLDWQYEQKVHEEVLHTWALREILDSHELLEEGKQMRHCVYTYTGSCAKGRSVILSLRCDGKRALTIEYLPEQKRFGDVRGHCNRMPSKVETNILKRWAQEKDLHMALLLMP